MTYYWLCTKDPEHKSADFRDAVFLHWNIKYCVKCGAPMKDVRSTFQQQKTLARAEQMRRGK